MKIINSRVFKNLVLFFILGIFLGIISFFVIKSNSNNIINYFESINNEKFNYLLGLFTSIKYNYKYLFIIWICGIICFMVFIIPFIVCFRGISLGYTISLIIYTYKLKGFIMLLIMLFPCVIINEFIYILESYYAINLSTKTIKIIKDNKSITIRNYLKNYLYQFLIFLVVLLFSSIFEIYISSNIIKYVI